MDYQDQDTFANSIVDQTLDTLRDQNDMQGEQSLHGNVSINPQAFSLVNDTNFLATLSKTSRATLDQLVGITSRQRRHLILGPINFENAFAKEPDSSFGQKSEPIPMEPVTTAQATTYTPFLVQPYVYQYIWKDGAVAGFYMGLYALTSPVPGSTTHTISWKMDGEGSRYQDQDVPESWTDDYVSNEATFLDDTTVTSDDSDASSYTYTDSGAEF